MKHWVRASLPSNKWSFKRWFAWRPVLVGEFWVWLQTIERRDWHDESNTRRDYRFADEAEEDYESDYQERESRGRRFALDPVPDLR